ncbi:Hypothetical protein A7982_04263 [Minicystis rosea]|nr:Hypothetical protein A7982_04263 [Minicystis rosea]
MQINPYVVLTIQFFRTQLRAARAAGDAAQAETFAAALRSLQEETNLHVDSTSRAS